MKVGIKNAFSKKKLFYALAVLVLIVVMVVSNPEVNRFFTSVDSVKLTFQKGIEYDMIKYGKTMLLANNEGIYAVDNRGRESWTVVLSATSPHIVTSGNYIMLADLNGKTVRSFKKESLETEIQTKNEILCAKLNKNGYIAVATQELGYKGMVLLYNKNGNEIFRWHSGEGYIGDIDISAQSKIAVAQLMTEKDKLYTRILILDTKKENEAKCIAEIDGAIMKLKYQENGNLIAVSQNGIYGFKASGKEKFKVDFLGHTLINCNIENQNNMVFAFNSGLNSTLIESYSASGKLRGSCDIGDEMSTFDVNGECIVVAKRDKIVRLTPKGAVKKEIKASANIKDIRIFSDRDKILCLGSHNAEIISLK